MLTSSLSVCAKWNNIQSSDKQPFCVAEWKQFAVWLPQPWQKELIFLFSAFSSPRRGFAVDVCTPGRKPGCYVCLFSFWAASFTQDTQQHSNTNNTKQCLPASSSSTWADGRTIRMQNHYGDGGCVSFFYAGGGERMGLGLSYRKLWQDWIIKVDGWVISCCNTGVKMNISDAYLLWPPPAFFKWL